MEEKGPEISSVTHLACVLWDHSPGRCKNTSRALLSKQQEICGTEFQLERCSHESSAHSFHPARLLSHFLLTPEI